MSEKITDLRTFKVKKNIDDKIIVTNHPLLAEFKIGFIKWDHYIIKTILAKAIVESYNDNSLILQITSYLLTFNQRSSYYKKAVGTLKAIVDTKNANIKIRTSKDSEEIRQMTTILEGFVTDEVTIMMIDSILYIYSTIKAIEIIHTKVFLKGVLPIKYHDLKKQIHEEDNRCTLELKLKNPTIH